jgi:hypothetical protein
VREGLTLRVECRAAATREQRHASLFPSAATGQHEEEGRGHHRSGWATDQLRTGKHFETHRCRDGPICKRFDSPSVQEEADGARSQRERTVSWQPEDDTHRNARSVNADGFGGHTPLFGSVRDGPRNAPQSRVRAGPPRSWRRPERACVAPKRRSRREGQIWPPRAVPDRDRRCSRPL